MAEDFSVFAVDGQDKVIINDVFRASGRASAPTFCLLNGIDGGVDNKGWFGLTDIAEYFGNKPVNVLDCTQRSRMRAKAAGVPITFVVRSEGAHARTTWASV